MRTTYARLANNLGLVCLTTLLVAAGSSCSGEPKPTDPYMGLDDQMEVATTEFRITMVKGALKQLGFYSGPIDKNWDRETQDAVRRYQRDRGLPVNGEYSVELVDRLMVKEAQ